MAYAALCGPQLRAGTLSTGGIYGLIKILRRVLNTYQGYQPIMLWDGHARWRYELYPAYKASRATNKQVLSLRASFKTQWRDMSRTLHTLGVRQMWNKQAEADDLAGFVTARAVKAGHPVVLLSGDQDWMQLIDKDVIWYDPIRERTVNDHTFAGQTGFATPRQFLAGKALCGDTSDNINARRICLRDLAVLKPLCAWPMRTRCQTNFSSRCCAWRANAARIPPSKSTIVMCGS
jgi:DNA polymerase-1